MKCRRCGEKAAINMRQHKLALCKDHFLEWIPEKTQHFIETYEMFDHKMRILVAVSGGKDSLSLWDVLLRLGYKADGLYIGLGIDGGAGYSAESQRFSEAFAEQAGARLIVHDVPATEGAGIPQAAELTLRGRGKPCSLCGLTKRHVMNRLALEHGYDVLVTGHNLDDEAAVLFGNTLNWQVGYLQRQAPVLPGRPGMMRKAKPFCRFYERETAAYALLRGIDYIYEECPHAAGAKSIYYKELLNQLEANRPGAKLAFYLAFLRAKEQMVFRSQDESGALHPCPACGQLTSAEGECAYCRTWSSVRQKLQPALEEVTDD